MDPAGTISLLPERRFAAALAAASAAPFDSDRSFAISWRIAASCIAPVSLARFNTRSTRPSRCGYQGIWFVSDLKFPRIFLVDAPLVHFPPRARWLRPRANPCLSIDSVVDAIAQPSPSAPSRSSRGDFGIGHENLIERSMAIHLPQRVGLQCPVGAYLIRKYDNP